MLSDEEKKDNVFKISMPIITNEELERLNYIIENDLDNIVHQISETVSRDKDIIILKKIIEKQSKEIEELKQDKLELINKNHVVHLKDVEKELREMRKVIDTKNAEIECLNIIHESYKEMVEENNFISKDKINAKIEELEKQDRENRMSHNYLVIPVLQSLLEKE